MARGRVLLRKLLRVLVIGFGTILCTVASHAAKSPLTAEQIAALVKLDARGYCLPSDNECRYHISKNQVEDQGPARQRVWHAMVLRNLIVAGFPFYPPGDTDLQIWYDAYGNVTSTSRMNLPDRNADDAEVYFMAICRRSSQMSPRKLDDTIQSAMCECMMKTVLADSAVREFLLTPKKENQNDNKFGEMMRGVDQASTVECIKKRMNSNQP